MPATLKKVKGGYQASTPNHPEGHSKKPMTLRNAKRQLRLLNAIEHGFKPTGKR